VPSDVERLVAAAIREALADRNVMVDGVMHGAFDDEADLIAGPKTIHDIWKLIPYENYIVTAQLLPDEIKAAMEEVFASHEKRNLVGFDLKAQGRSEDYRILSMSLADGQPIDRNKRYLIAFNSFDSRSAGHHFMKLRVLLERPDTKCVLHPLQTRDAVIDYFQRHKVVSQIPNTLPLIIAA
jgi:2',3'-cyclic-nucleotide 2'-phosphodiesterase (5'-nucleotidase family)